MSIIHLIAMLLAYSIPVNIIKGIRTEDEKKCQDYMFLSGVACALLVLLFISSVSTK